MRKSLAIVSVLVGMLACAALSGCSTSVQVDTFYPKKLEPRTEMSWYGSVSGNSNRNGFKQLGD